MATIPVKPGVPLGNVNEVKALTFKLPHDGTGNAPQVGDFLKVASGYVNEGSDAPGAAALAGVCNKRCVAVPTAGDLVDLILAMPGKLWEFSTDAAGLTTIDDVLGVSFESNRDATVLCAVIDDNVSTTPVFTGVCFAYLLEDFEVGRYIAKAGTSETAGSTHHPATPSKGYLGDTSPRIIVTFDKDILALAK